MPKTTADKDVVLRAQALYDKGIPFDRILPITLENGSVIDRFAVVCARCEGPLQNDRVRGFVSRIAGDTRLAEGVAFCARCNLFTPFRVHIKPQESGFRLKPLDHVPLLQPEPGVLLPFGKGRNRGDGV